jgi:hypothetical protein
MNRLRQVLVVLFFAGAIGSVMGATIYSDDFSDSSQSKLKWVSSSLSLKFSNGALGLTNSDTTYSGLLIHNLSAPKPTKFTLSAKFTVSDPKTNGAGLVFCFSSAGGLKGYTFQIGSSQFLYSLKYLGTTNPPTPPVQLHAPSQEGSVNALTNVIKVSKNNDTINLFCNDVFIDQILDSQFPSGDISLFVPPKSTVTVDDVLLTDDFIKGAMPTCFSDSFQSTSEKGWIIDQMEGPITLGGGQLTLEDTSSTLPSFIYTKGNFANASMKAVVSHVSGQGSYGVAFISAVPAGGGQITFKTYAFLVDSSQHYEIIYPDTPKVYLRGPYSVIHGSKAKDTLEVLRYNDRYVFKVNGEDVGATYGETFPIPTEYKTAGITYAGVFVGAKTKATYNLFMVGGDSSGAKCPVDNPVFQRNVRHFQPVPYRFGQGGVVVNVMGRKIGIYDWHSFTKAKTAAVGTYIILQKGAEGSARAMKAIKLK